MDKSEKIIEQIISLINENDGSFTTAEVFADHSPHFASKGKLTHLIEEFYDDGAKVFVYDPSSYCSDEIDSYAICYEEIEESQLEYILELAETIKDFK